MSYSRGDSSSFSSFSQLHQAREALVAAEAELAAVQSELEEFEKQVESLLGPLLDQLSTLDAEVKLLTSRLIDLRESRLFGDRRASYSGPYFAHLPDPTIPDADEKSTRPSESKAAGAALPTPNNPQAELKRLYRRLARRYHPDLARDESERAQNTEQMTAINQAYAIGDLGSLRRLAGIYVPDAIPDYLHPTQHHSEIERLKIRLRQVQEQIKHLEALPIIKLNIEAKLARRQGRSLLSEMANDLRRKLARKTAERDYLRSQLDHA